MDENNLTRSNLEDWNRDLMIASRTDMITHVLKSDTHILPTKLELRSIGNALPKWHEHD